LPPGGDLMSQMNTESQQVRMVEHQLRARGIQDPRVLSAMRRVPRHEFVPETHVLQAYRDAPLPIGEGQTISQPFMVGLMTESLGLKGGERVLELGTGSGYQTAVLLEMGAIVWTIERSASLHARAESRLQALGYEKVCCVHGDGTLGYPEAAPFDRVLATGSLPSIPDALLDQLTPHGVFVGPIGGYHDQELVRVTTVDDESSEEVLCDCRFVPLVGDAGWKY